jgi:hypothetical protein
MVATEGEAFFGFMGVVSALVFASTDFLMALIHIS